MSRVPAVSLLIALAGCLADASPAEYPAPGATSVRLQAVSLNHASITGVLRWRLDETSSAPSPEWRASGGRRGRCAAIYLVGDVSRETAMDIELSAPPGFIQGSFETASPISLGTSSEVGVVPTVSRYRIPFPNATFPAVGAAEGDLVFRYTGDRAGPFVEIARVPLRVYTILGTPTLPWVASSDSELNPHAPWLRALDIATRWARGARTRDEAASLITNELFELGTPGKGSRLRWDRAQAHFCSEYSLQPAHNTVSVDRFFLTDFLDALDLGGPAQPVNCSDTASAVYAFANLLGCNLTLVTLRVDRSLTHEVNFKLRPIRPMGSVGVVEGLSFTFHQVAWSGSMDRGGLVYDPCVAFPGEGRPRPVCGLRFGDATEQNSYIARLTPDAPAIVLRHTEQRSIAPLRLEEPPPGRRPHSSGEGAADRCDRRFRRRRGARHARVKTSP